MVTRRTFLAAGGAAAVAAAAIARPHDEGGPYPAYFAAMNRTLRAQRIDRPVLVIDMDRLDRNIARVRQSAAVAPAKTYRIVVKSLPSPALIDYVAKAAGTNAFMVFHRPFLNAMAALRPDADILLGKPMPVDAARHFYADLQGAFKPERQLQWLIDTNARLAQYQQLARELGVKMRINFELDVGLHRGGFDDHGAMTQALATIAADPQHLEFAGFMGYDAHLMGLPAFLAEREFPKVRARYQGFVDLLKASQPAMAAKPLCLNGAGSPTFRLYEGDALLNDLSAGTCLMKPSHYDLPTLAEFEPSAFIATPVLKRLAHTRLPSLEWTAPLLEGWNPNMAQTYFIYSGNWLAEPEAPPGLHPHFAYVSSNQQGLNGSAKVPLEVDDFVFLRPLQSEAVLLQFGDLLALRGDKVAARWPVLTAAL
ncbi:alanine racemase [Duganella sp. LX20W]|uniref:Alanine racemase n=1 Tax=Rugamonas brunnea TaxID=2758569 RepID=A0A7W2EPC7_9BURK|nr:alanine racemase [Rugamonas brunnea]MBA5636004.1 alanine racemase [Rugamonas brunnea]